MAFIYNAVTEISAFKKTLETQEVKVDNQKAIASRKNLLEVLTKLDALSIAEKREMLLFIPQSNLTYWTWSENCLANPFIAPAITGIAMLDGLPPADCEVAYYGYPAYELRSPSQPSMTVNDTPDICQAAQEKGFRKVIVIDSDQVHEFRIEPLNCETLGTFELSF